MTLWRRNPKRDGNEQEIIDALEAAGAYVLRLSGPGIPDLLVGYRRRWGLVEVKTEAERCTPAQIATLSVARRRRLPFAVVRSPEEARRFLRELKS